MMGIMPTLTALMLVLAMTQSANYSARHDAEQGIPIVVLADRDARTEVRIVPTLGNRAYSMTVGGRDILWSPYKTLAEYKAKPTGLGVPFMAPWANRLEGDYYYVNGRKYTLRADIQNFRRDGNGKPIHGLLSTALEWEVISLKADEDGAEAVSRLEFWRYPAYMAQFPFAHSIEMTYRLSGGTLEVRTAVTNLSSEEMPIGIGFHPYFQLPGVPRETWRVTLPVRRRWVLSKELLPTGATEPWSERVVSPMDDRSLDDVFGDLVQDAAGKAEFSVEGGDLRVSVVFGKFYPVSVVYAPAGRPFICFEPMTAVTNAFNLNQAGGYPGLQTVAPGKQWGESFWVRPSVTSK